MGLINAQPRFGYDSEERSIFDYLTSRSVKVGDEFDSVDGRWDSVKLVELIKTNQAVDGARVCDKVEQANADFSSEIDAENARREAAAQQEAAERAEREEQAKRDAAAAEEQAKAQAEQQAKQQEGPKGE